MEEKRSLNTSLCSGPRVGVITIVDRGKQNGKRRGLQPIGIF